MTNNRIIFAIFFLLFSPAYSYSNITLDRVVAVVNQEVITWSELYRSMEADASPSVKEMKQEEKLKIFRENEAGYLESLINQKLQLQEAVAQGMNVTDEDLKEAINTIKAKYNLTDQSFEQSLKKEGYTLEEYKKRLREQILISKIVNQQIRSKIIISDEDVNKFMKENRDLIDFSESYRISQILLKKQGNNQDELNKKASEILQMLSQGMSFSDLAKQYSEDPSAKAGGDLGILKRSQIATAFIEALKGLKPGDISRPFWTQQGIHIIKLDEMIEAKNPEEIKEEVKKMLNNKIFMEKYNAWIKSLREKSFIDIRL